MGKSTISMAMFNSYVNVYQRVPQILISDFRMCGIQLVYDPTFSTPQMG